MKIAVADTGALVSLEKISDGFVFIRQIYDKIYVPPQVLTEAAYHYSSASAYLEDHNITDFIVVEKTKEAPNFLRRLDLGERYAISLAIQKNEVLLIEEFKGAREAVDQGVSVSGISGQVVLAYRENIVTRDEAIFLLQELCHHSRISLSLYEHILEEELKQ